MTDHFTEDNRYQQVAEAYAMDAVDFAREHFKLDLDWTDGSVAHIETMIGVFHEQLAQAESEEQVQGFAKMFGSYVGEVFRRNHGATWGLVQVNGETFPGLKADRNSGLFWPWGRAQNRIMNGPEDNMWHYYQYLLEKYGSNSTPSPQKSPAKKKSLWTRLRGSA